MLGRGSLFILRRFVVAGRYEIKIAAGDPTLYAGELFGSWLTAFTVPVALRRRVAPGLPLTGVFQIKNTGVCAVRRTHPAAG